MPNVFNCNNVKSYLRVLNGIGDVLAARGHVVLLCAAQRERVVSKTVDCL